MVTKDMASKFKKLMFSKNKAGLKATSFVGGMAISTYAFAGALTGFLAPFCKVQQIFSGQSPIVAFVILLALLFIGGSIVLGEDKGIVSVVVKFLVGGAVLIGGAALVSAIFGISLGCA